MKTRRKRYQAKNKKSVFKKRFFWLGVLAVLSGLGMIYLIIFSPVFQIKTIAIFGLQKITLQEIQNFVWSIAEKKVFWLPIKNVFSADFSLMKIKLREKFPLIEEIKIRRQLLNSLLIEVKEREAVGVWCQEESCFSLDKNGVIFEATDKKEGLLVNSKQAEAKISPGQKVVDLEYLAKIIEIRKTIKEKAKIEIKEFFFFEKEKRLNARTIEGWQVYFDLRRDLNWQLVELELILEKQLPQEKRQNLEYIELRFEKVYYK